MVTLIPFELLDRIAVLIPPPRRYRHHGVIAPNAALRAMVTACAGQPITLSLELFDIDISQCSRRGAALRVLAAILAHIDTRAARAPPLALS